MFLIALRDQSVVFGKEIQVNLIHHTILIKITGTRINYTAIDPAVFSCKDGQIRSINIIIPINISYEARDIQVVGMVCS